MEKNKDILKKFGKKVKELRQKQGFSSQMALALKARIDRTYIGGIERGERNVSLKNIEKLANALEVNTRELFDF
jgi:transcriptional regulator with XRE-family HTH domain